MGKTQIAVEYAERVWRDGAVDLLVWISASSRVAVHTGYARAAAELTGVDCVDPVQGAARFLTWLAQPPEHARGWLVVLDDLTAPGDLAELWPPATDGGRVCWSPPDAATPHWPRPAGG